MKLLRTLLSVALAVAVLAPAAAQAATPLTGVPTKIRRGFYTNTDLGAFFTVGGNGTSPSNAQAYLALGLGYDLYAQGDHLLSLGAGFSMGTSAGGCYGQMVEAADGPRCMGTTDPSLALSDNWTATTFEASALYGFQIANRLMLTGRVLGGMANIEPVAFEGTDGMVPLVGFGLGAEYATQFDHFSLGLEVAGKNFIGPNALGIAVAPRIKYTF